MTHQLVSVSTPGLHPHTHKPLSFQENINNAISYEDYYFTKFFHVPQFYPCKESWLNSIEYCFVRIMIHLKGLDIVDRVFSHDIHSYSM